MSSVPEKLHHNTVLSVLLAISLCHMLNDIVQSLIPAVYPILKDSFQLNFTQIGLITFTFQCVASLLQPAIGIYTDKRPFPYSLPMGMGFTLVGLLLLAMAPSFLNDHNPIAHQDAESSLHESVLPQSTPTANNIEDPQQGKKSRKVYQIVLIAAALVGIGSAVFHPESSRVARMASGGRHGFAQSLFQVGGNTGSALGPLLAAFIVLPNGLGSIAWFSIVAVLGIAVLLGVSAWSKRHHVTRLKAHIREHGLAPRVVSRSILVLLVLTFSKNFYLASITSYYTFFLIHKFNVSVQSAQLHLFLFLGAAAAGTIIGGIVGDRVGRRFVIWVSILGVLPFTLVLPYASLAWTGVLSVIIGFILASAFSAILVFAQELVPGKVGMISGLFFGCAFGMAGIGAAILGRVADHTSIEFVYRICSFLPLLGLFTAFLPNLERAVGKAAAWPIADNAAVDGNIPVT